MYPDMTTTWYTTNDATFEVTGLQLEVGSQATPFEHRSFGEELKLCQRYYQVGSSIGASYGSAHGYKRRTDRSLLANGNDDADKYASG